MTLAGLAARNVLRNKLRLILTICAMAVAVLTFVFLRTLLWSWTVAVEAAPKDRVFTRNKITIAMTLPKRYIDQLRAQPHVKAATYATWFAAKYPPREREFFAKYAVDPSTYFDVYDEIMIKPEEKAVFLEKRTGVLVGDTLAKKLGWKIGDRVTLDSGVFGSGWQFDIVGIYTGTGKTVDRSSFFFRWDYLNEGVPFARMKDRIGWMVSRVDDPAHSADIGRAIDKSFETKEIRTLSQDERSFTSAFLSGVAAALRAVDVVSFAILIIMLLILANTIAMGVRERTNEYGVLRAMGYKPRQVAAFIVGESMLTGVLGGAVGLLIAYPIIEFGIGRWMEENVGAFFPYCHVNPWVATAAVLLSLTLGGIAGGVPAYFASKLRVVDALRGIA